MKVKWQRELNLSFLNNEYGALTTASWSRTDSSKT